jgi:hypothetical protein
MTASRKPTKATIEGAETVQNFSDAAELLLTARLLPGFLLRLGLLRDRTSDGLT